MQESTTVATSTSSVVPRALRALLLLGLLVVLWWLALALAAGSHASGAERRAPDQDARPGTVADLIGGTGRALAEEGVTVSRTTVEQVDTALTRSPAGRVAAPVVRPVVDDVVSPTLDRLARATETDGPGGTAPGVGTATAPSPAQPVPRPASRTDVAHTSRGPAAAQAHQQPEALPVATPPRVSLSSPAPAVVPDPTPELLDDRWGDRSAELGVASPAAGTVGGGGGPALLTSTSPAAAAPLTRLHRVPTAAAHLAPPHEPGCTPD